MSHSGHDRVGPKTTVHGSTAVASNQHPIVGDVERMDVLINPLPDYDHYMGSGPMCWREVHELPAETGPRRAGLAEAL